MFRYTMSLYDAYKFIISLRPQVRPNSHFKKQLEAYEQELSYNRFKLQLKNKTLNILNNINNNNNNNNNINIISHSLNTASTFTLNNSKI